MTITPVLTTEFRKLHRCKVTSLSLAALSLGPLGIALFMWIVREPGRAAELGLLGAKANLSGLALALLGLSARLALSGARNALLAAALAFLLAPAVAWITTPGRGYLPPLGFAVAMLALGNMFAKTGWAPWFPWSIIPLSIGMVGQPVQTLPVGSFVVVALTFAAGIVATIVQLRYADNTQ